MYQRGYRPRPSKRSGNLYNEQASGASPPSPPLPPPSASRRHSGEHGPSRGGWRGRTAYRYHSRQDYWPSTEHKPPSRHRRNEPHLVPGNAPVVPDSPFYPSPGHDAESPNDDAYSLDGREYNRGSSYRQTHYSRNRPLSPSERVAGMGRDAMHISQPLPQPTTTNSTTTTTRYNDQFDDPRAQNRWRGRESNDNRHSPGGRYRPGSIDGRPCEWAQPPPPPSSSPLATIASSSLPYFRGRESYQGDRGRGIGSGGDGGRGSRTFTSPHRRSGELDDMRSPRSDHHHPNPLLASSLYQSSRRDRWPEGLRPRSREGYWRRSPNISSDTYRPQGGGGSSSSNNVGDAQTYRGSPPQRHSFTGLHSSGGKPYRRASDFYKDSHSMERSSAFAPVRHHNSLDGSGSSKSHDSSDPQADHSEPKLVPKEDRAEIQDGRHETLATALEEGEVAPKCKDQCENDISQPHRPGPENARNLDNQCYRPCYEYIRRDIASHAEPDNPASSSPPPLPHHEYNRQSPVKSLHNTPHTTGLSTNSNSNNNYKGSHRRDVTIAHADPKCSQPQKLSPESEEGLAPKDTVVEEFSSERPNAPFPVKSTVSLVSAGRSQVQDRPSDTKEALVEDGHSSPSRSGSRRDSMLPAVSGLEKQTSPPPVDDTLATDNKTGPKDTIMPDVHEEEISEIKDKGDDCPYAAQPITAPKPIEIIDISERPPKEVLMQQISIIDSEIEKCYKELEMLPSDHEEEGASEDGGDSEMPICESPKRDDVDDKSPVASNREPTPSLLSGFASSPTASESSGLDICSSEDTENADLAGELMRQIYAENQYKAANANFELARPFLAVFPTFVPGIYVEPQDWPFWRENEAKHELLRPRITQILGSQRAQTYRKARELRKEYRQLYARWQEHIERLDMEKEERERPRSAGGSKGRARRTPDNSYDPTMEAELEAISLHSRRAGQPLSAGLGDLYTSDAVRSEAELIEVIQRLQYDELRNPDIRSRRTTASIPNMVLDHQERVALQFNNENHKVEDPLAFYHVILPDSDPVQQQQPPTRPPAPRRRNSSLKVGDGIPASIVSEMTGPDVPAHGPLFNNNSDPDNIWTNEEKDIFVREYLQHPKQFGKIALALPFKNPRECVLFYYRNKKSLNLKHLMLKQARKARRNRKMSTKKRKEKAKERREQERRARDAQAQRARCSSVGADGSDVDAYATVQPDELAVSDEETFLTHGKGGALLRSIIAANKKRKHQVLPYLSGMGIPHVSPSLVYPDEEENEDARSRGASSVDTPLAPLSSRRSRSPEPDENSVVGVLRSTGRRISVDATDSEDYSVNITAYQSEESDVGREDPPVLSTYPPLKPQQRRISKPPGLALVEQVPDAANNGELEERAEAEEGEEEEEGEMVGDEREKGQSPKTQSTSYLRREEFDNIAEREMIIPCTGTNKLEARDGSVPAEDALDKHLDPGTPLPAFIAKLNGDASSGKGLADSSAPIADASSHAPNLSWESKAGGPLRVDASAVYASVEEQIARAIGTEPVVFVGAAKWKRDERARAIKALVAHGPDFVRISKSTATKTATQCRYFYNKYQTSEGVSLSKLLATWTGARHAQTQALSLGPTSAGPLGTMQIDTQTANVVEKGKAIASPMTAHPEMGCGGSGGTHSTLSISMSLSAREGEASGSVRRVSTETAANLSMAITSVKRKSSESRRSSSVEPTILPPKPSDSMTTEGDSDRQHLAKRHKLSPRPGGSSDSTGILVPTPLPAMHADGSSSDEEEPLAVQLSEALDVKSEVTLSGTVRPVTKKGQSDAAAVAGAGKMPSTAGKRIGVNITKVHEIAQPTSDQLKPVITPSVSTLMLPPQTAKNRSQPMSHPQSESDIPTDGAHSRPVDDIGQVSAASGATTPMGPVGGASRAALTSVAQPPPQPKKSYWSVQERANFAHLLALLGTDWQLMARAIGSKTATQARNFFKAHRERLNLDKALQEYETLKAQNKLPSPESIIASIQGGMSTPIVQDGEVINVELVKERRGRKRKPHTLVPPSPVLEPSPQEQPQTQQLQPQPQYKPQVAPPRTAGPALSSAAVQKEMSLDQAAQLAAMKAQKSRIIAAETAVFPVLPSMPRALRMPNIVTPTRGLDNKTQQQQQPILPSKPSLATKSTQSVTVRSPRNPSPPLVIGDSGGDGGGSSSKGLPAASILASPHPCAREPTPESRPRPSGFRIDALLNDETPLPSPFKEAEHSQGERSETVEPTPPPLPHVRAKLEAEEEGGQSPPLRPVLHHGHKSIPIIEDNDRDEKGMAALALASMMESQSRGPPLQQPIPSRYQPLPQPPSHSRHQPPLLPRSPPISQGVAAAQPNSGSHHYWRSPPQFGVDADGRVSTAVHNPRPRALSFDRSKDVVPLRPSTLHPIQQQLPPTSLHQQQTAATTARYPAQATASPYMPVGYEQAEPPHAVQQPPPQQGYYQSSSHHYDPNFRHYYRPHHPSQQSQTQQQQSPHHLPSMHGTRYQQDDRPHGQGASQPAPMRYYASQVYSVHSPPPVHHYHHHHHRQATYHHSLPSSSAASGSGSSGNGTLIPSISSLTTTPILARPSTASPIHVSSASGMTIPGVPISTTMSQVKQHQHQYQQGQAAYQPTGVVIYPGDHQARRTSSPFRHHNSTATTTDSAGSSYHHSHHPGRHQQYPQYTPHQTPPPSRKEASLAIVGSVGGHRDISGSGGTRPGLTPSQQTASDSSSGYAPSQAHYHHHHTSPLQQHGNYMTHAQPAPSSHQFPGYSPQPAMIVASDSLSRPPSRPDSSTATPAGAAATTINSTIGHNNGEGFATNPPGSYHH